MIARVAIILVDKSLEHPLGRPLAGTLGPQSWHDSPVLARSWFYRFAGCQGTKQLFKLSVLTLNLNKLRTKLVEQEKKPNLWF
jgi:hypothetical protein